jgi:class 3 adenylate cyclase
MKYKFLESFKTIFFPFSATFNEIVSRYVLFNDRSPEENEAFRDYIQDLAKRFSVFVFTFLIGLILITWPTDYIYFEDPKIINSYFWWRLIGSIALSGLLFGRQFTDWIDRNFFIIILIGVLIFNFITGYIFGGISGYQDPWFRVIFVLPFISLFVPFTLAFRILITFTLPFGYLLGFWFHNPIRELNHVGLQFNLLLSLIFISIIFGHAIYAILRQNYFQSIELEDERAKANDLLHNTIPKPIVDRLKQGEEVADRFDEVTVLFADIVEFTPLADKLPPEKVVSILDDIFCSFDDLSEEYKVEKIKTIGDEYFVASGVPKPANDHAVRCANYALKMQDIVKEHTRVNSNPFELRIGMNTGSLVAGVIGNKRFVYDVWGDIVNVGSRMESQGVPGKIQVTPATKQAIEKQEENGQFKFEKRGTIEVKGKGEMRTYFLDMK